MTLAVRMAAGASVAIVAIVTGSEDFSRATALD